MAADKGGVCSVRLEGEMTIYTANEQAECLLGELENCQTLELDLADISDIDSAGVQVLLALHRASDEIGHTLSLVNHSQSVLEVLELLDLQASLGAVATESENKDAP